MEKIEIRTNPFIFKCILHNFLMEVSLKEIIDTKNQENHNKKRETRQSDFSFFISSKKFTITLDVL